MGIYKIKKIIFFLFFLYLLYLCEGDIILTPSTPLVPRGVPSPRNSFAPSASTLYIKYFGIRKYKKDMTKQATTSTEVASKPASILGNFLKSEEGYTDVNLSQEDRAELDKIQFRVFTNSYGYSYAFWPNGESINFTRNSRVKAGQMISGRKCDIVMDDNGYLCLQLK